MTIHYDDLETRPQERRRAEQGVALVSQLARVAASEISCLVGAEQVRDLAGLAALPVLRKSDLVGWQGAAPPFGGIPVRGITHVFQSPGPIYEPGSTAPDWWRLGRFLHAAGIGPGDVVHNCFGYHLTPAGHMLESGARAVGATVLPAGTGQTELQVQAAAALGSTVYVGTDRKSTV